MTETEWLACDDPLVMIDHIGGKVSDRKVSDRKLRLFACACARLVWHLLNDTRSRDAVEVSERFADGLATAEELAAARTAAGAATGTATWDAAWSAARAAVEDATGAAAAAWDASWAAVEDAAGDATRDASGDAAWAAARDAAWSAARARQAVLLRDIVSNPFSSVVFSMPAHVEVRSDLWGLAHDLARAAYEHRLADGRLDPVRLAVLADALEDAQAPEQILQHLRSPGPHYRGMWSLDLVLGKG